MKAFDFFKKRNIFSSKSLTFLLIVLLSYINIFFSIYSLAINQNLNLGGIEEFRLSKDDSKIINSFNDSSVTLLSLKNNTTTKAKLSLEIAKSKDKLEKGLMFRKILSKNTGMLFIFSQPQELTFWMKNTFLSLDIIFLDQNLYVKNFYTSTVINQTNTLYPSNSNVEYVIEVSSGWINNNNLKNNDHFVFSM